MERDGKADRRGRRSSFKKHPGRTRCEFMINAEVACALAAHAARSSDAVQKSYFGASGEEDGRRLEPWGPRSDGETDDAPIVRLVTKHVLRTRSRCARASDIHIEPGHQAACASASASTGCCAIIAEHQEHLVRAARVSRLKIMAQMDIAEKRKPQDGRIGAEDQGARHRRAGVDPALEPRRGDRHALARPRRQSLISLRELGFQARTTSSLVPAQLIKRPNGIVSGDRAHGIGQDDDPLRGPERSSTARTSRSSPPRTRSSTTSSGIIQVPVHTTPSTSPS